MKLRIDIRTQGTLYNRISYTISTLLSTLGVDLTQSDADIDKCDDNSLWFVYGYAEDLNFYLNKNINMVFFIACPARFETETFSYKHFYHFTSEYIDSHYFFHSRINCNEGEVIANATDSDGRLFPAVWKFETPANVQIVVAADLILSAFSLLSRIEEYSSLNLDKHCRFDESESFLIKHRIQKRPLVNEYLSIIESWLLYIYNHTNSPYLTKAMFPEGKKWGICLSHDVDVMNLWQIYLLWLSLDALRKADLSNAINIIRVVLKNFFKKMYPLEVLRNLTTLEKQFQYTSTFFVFGSNAGFYEALKAGISYEILNDEILSLFRSLIRNNHEIALHGSYQSYHQKDRMRLEKEYLENAIGGKINGIRQHFLRFKAPETWKIQEECNFLYDSTLGFYSTNGFRAGCATPFQPYDLNNECPINILEIPLLLMDRSYTKYQGKDLKDVKKDILAILEQIKQRRGVGSILWHSHMLDSFGMIGYEDLYKTILQYLSENNAYVANMSEYSNWWLDRFNTKIVQESCSLLYSSWKISCERGAKDIHLELVVPKVSKYKVETDSDTVLIHEEGEHKFLINILELKQGEPVHLKVKGTV